MSLADKFEYLIGTKTAIRNALNGSGARIDESLPFRQYAGWVDWLNYSRANELRNLFANGETGTLSAGLPYFVDVDGNTPASWGDPVGLVRDASPNRADFTQPTVTARPILGRVPRGGRRNLYTRSQPDIDNPQWTTLTQGEGSIVTRIGREPGPNGIDGIRYQFERLVSGYTVVGGNLAGLPAGAYTHSLWAKSGDGETYTVSFYTEFSPSLTFEVGPEWQRLVIPSYRDEDGVVRHRWFGLTGHTSAYNSFADIIIADGQFEIGEAATDFQQVITPYDITEEGVPDVYYLDFDGTDDLISTELPAIENGTLVLAGTGGIWIDEDYNFAGGTFSIGPTSYTNGPEGILTAIGDPIERGFLVINRQLSQRERELVIQEMKERGAPGVLARQQLVINGDFSDDLNGWTVDSVPPANVSVVDGAAVLNRGGASAVSARLRQSFSTPAGANLLLEFDIVSNSGGGGYITAGISGAGTYNTTTNGSGKFSRWFVGTSASPDLFLVVAGNVNGVISVDNICVYRYILPGETP